MKVKYLFGKYYIFLFKNFFVFSLSDMLKLDDLFVTSVIVALSSFNYYHEGPCRNFLVQALKSSCTVIILNWILLSWKSIENNNYIRQFVYIVQVFFVLFFVVIQ